MLDVRLLSPRSLCGTLLCGRIRNAWASMLLVTGASVFVALCARVSLPLPFTPVPLTLQTLGVLTAGMALGGQAGFLALCLYLVEGALGMPVFAGGASGAHHLAGPTGGYLVSYPFAAGMAGCLAELGWDRRPASAFCAAAAATLLILAAGTAWLSIFTGSVSRAIVLGALPFMPGDLVKAAAAAALLPACWKGMAWLGFLPRRMPSGLQ